MKELVVTIAAVTTYLQFLKIQEKSKGTLEKYQRELLDLAKYLAGKKVTREDLVVWKEELEKRYSPAGVNGRLVAANGFFSFFGRYDLRLKLLKIQKEIFMREEKELTRAEYGRLVRTAERKGKEPHLLPAGRRFGASHDARSRSCYEILETIYFICS